MYACAYEIFNGFPCEKHDKSYSTWVAWICFLFSRLRANISSSNATLYSRDNLYARPLTSLPAEKISNAHARSKHELHLLKKKTEKDKKIRSSHIFAIATLILTLNKIFKYR